MGVGLITDANLCETIYKNYKNNPVVLWKVDENEIDPTSDKEIHVIQGSDTKEILNSVLSFLPNPIELDESDFRVRIIQIRKFDISIFFLAVGCA